MVITHGVSRAVHELPLHTPQIILIRRFDHQPIRNITNVGAVREHGYAPVNLMGAEVLTFLHAQTRE